LSKIIEVRGLSKSYIINHEGKESYTALRDVIAHKAKKIFSFPNWKSTVKTQEEFWALKDIDFDIKQGDRVGIIGRNGAGKSTLLKILSRITEPTNGSIKIKGRIASLLEVGTGFHPELTGRENIYLNGAILGMSRAEIKKHFDAIVDFAEVERFLDTPVKRYSSGMYVRLAFAVAAHLEPEILIVDEVLAVGDAQFQKKCLGKMEDVSKNEGRTVLFVSHNMGVVSKLCNKGILLNKGKIEIDGEIDHIIQNYVNFNNLTTEGFYYDKLKVNGKANFIKTVVLRNSENQAKSDFTFNEKVRIDFVFNINEDIPNLQIGIGIQDKLQNRVSTILKPISFFNKNDKNEIHGFVDLPLSIIAPNYYSLVVAIWAKDLVINDIQENICPFRIHDNGSEFALYEGYDYGSVILNPNWHNA
jgi:lipopolysaccharide transport system ATP-binding protein